MKINLSSPPPLGKKSAAFSLLEVVFGMAIIGTVVGAMVSGITNGTFTMRMARENLRATQILQEKMETIRLYRWDQINASGFIPTNFTDTFYPLNQTNHGLVYTGILAVVSAPMTESYSNSLRQVTVTVNWSSGGVRRQRQMTTLVAQYGLQNYIY